jgi:transcriptional regulator with XRE-family HTH domain
VCGIVPFRSRPQHPIRQYRDRYGLSQLAFARRADMSVGGLSRIESCGTIMPSIFIIQQLVDACVGEVSPCDIFLFHFSVAFPASESETP